jgi:tetratricopeptide (TPR) repeat protein
MSIVSRSVSLPLLLVLIGFVPLQAWAQTPVFLEPNPLVRAQKFIDAGEAGAAFELLSTLEAARAGALDFDYIYGVSALDSGRPQLAVFALMRVIVADPDFAGARVELARAYLSVGDKASARKELDIALTQKPPPKVERLIQPYIAISEGAAAPDVDKPKATHVTGYLEATGGWDSNANASTSDSSFLGFQLDETAVRASSPFGRLRGGVTVNHRTSPNWSLVGRGNAAHRLNTEARFIDTTQADAYAGARYLSDRELFSFGVQGYRVNADSDLNNQGGGLLVDWRRMVGERDHWAFSGRLFGIRYAERLKIQDVDQMAFGLSYVHRIEGKHDRTVSATLLGGFDWTTEEGSPYDRNFAGLRLTAGSVLTETISLTGSIGWLYSKYGGDFFGH